jgi:hypothetical protein
MQLTDVVILGLAVHRAVSLWTADEITRPIREWTFRTRLAPLTRCPWCLSVWMAAGFSVLWIVGGIIGVMLVATFAISTSAVVCEWIIRWLWSNAARSDGTRQVFGASDGEGMYDDMLRRQNANGRAPAP